MTLQTKDYHTGPDVAQDKKVRADRRCTLATVLSERRGKIQYRILDKEKVVRSNVISAKKKERVGHWNVRTLYSTGKSYCLTKELRRLNIKICGISETHWVGCGRMTVNGYTIWYSGTETGIHEHGVAIALESCFTRSVTDVIFLSDRLIKIRMRCKNVDITIIEAYAPTEGDSDEEKDKFYNNLQHLIDKTPRHDLILLLGDFNAKVGNNFGVWGKILGKHGIQGDENDNGTRLLELCSNNNLCITNTQFIQKVCRKLTWTSPDNKTENLIDYIITREEWLTSVRKTRVYRSAEINSDHHLIMSEIKVKLSGKKVPRKKRFDMEKLNEMDVQNKFQIKIQNRFEVLTNLTDDKDPEIEWENFKIEINKVAEEELGYRKIGKRNWISKETEELQAEIRKSKEAAMNPGKNGIEKTTELNELRTQLKKRLIKDKNKMLEETANEMEDAYKRGDSKKLFANVNKLSGSTITKIINIEPVKDRNGEILTEKEKIMARWKQHFDEILNREDPNNTEETFNEINQSEDRCKLEDEIGEEDDITLEEIERAVKQMRKNKAPGLCNITAEMLQNSGVYTIRWLHRVITAVWQTEKTPSDWRKAIIIPIHKKGDRKECNNARGISLLSVPGKVFTRVMLNRINDTVDETLRENQCGFRKGRGCSDQIFILRQLIEKKLEFNEDLVMCFIDFAQAYDSIWREGAWKLLGKYGIHAKIIRIMENLYSTVLACIRIDGEETEWFKIKTGFRQGCILSPMLFNIILDYIMRRIEGTNGLGTSLKPGNIDDAEYADDTCLIAECLSRIVELTLALVTESGKFGLKINTNKTKIMPITKKDGEWPIVSHNGKEIEIVKNFVYLGSELEAKGGSDLEIKRKIAMAGSIFNRLHTKIFKRHDIGMKTKLRILNTCVIPILIYGCESWTIKKELEKKIIATENKWLRRILRIGYKEHITNEEVRERTLQPSIMEVIRKRRMKWTGHILRMEEIRNPKRIFNYKPEGRRSKGRPKRRWVDGLEEDLHMAGLNLNGKTDGRHRMTLEEIAKDRELWRDVMEKSIAGHSWRTKT